VRLTTQTAWAYKSSATISGGSKWLWFGEGSKNVLLACFLERICQYCLLIAILEGTFSLFMALKKPRTLFYLNSATIRLWTYRIRYKWTRFGLALFSWTGLDTNEHELTWVWTEIIMRWMRSQKVVRWISKSCHDVKNNLHVDHKNISHGHKK